MDEKEFFGARKETLEYLKSLYKEEYLEQYSNASDLTAPRRKMYLMEFERIKRRFDLNKGGNVLDIGCGTGEFLELFGKNWKKYGIEISDGARKLANKKGVITDFKLKDNFFDIIIFRGTIQHIPDPFHKIEESYYWLKKSGIVVFLATPNTHSIVYKLFNDLPMIYEKFNFLLPSDKILRQTLTNFRFNDIEFEYPYKNTPYAKGFRDYIKLVISLIFRSKKKPKFAFPGNMMECYARK